MKVQSFLKLEQPKLRYRFSLLLTIISIILFSIGIVKSEQVIDRFGLISSFDITFFISLSLLVFAAFLLWTSKERHYWLSGLQLLFLIVCLYATPFLLEGTARFQAAYQNYGFVDYILRNGKIDEQNIWYHAWPGAWILFTSIFKVLGISEPFIVIGIFPTIMQVVLLVPLFLIFRAVTSSNYNKYWAFAWIFTLINWTNQEYFSAQAIGYVFLLLILALVLTKQLNISNKTTTIILLLLLVALVLTHLISLIVVLLFLILMQLFLKKNRLSFTLLIISITAVWIIYGAIYQLHYFLPAFITEAFRIDLIYLTSFFNRFSQTSSDHIFINNVRLIFSSACFLFATLGFIFQKNEKFLSRVNISFVAIAISPIILIPIFVYSGEFIIRVFFFMLVPISYFIYKITDRKVMELLLVFILIIFVPIHLLAHYGNEVIDHTPKTEISFTDYFYHYTNDGLLMGNLPPTSYMYLEKYSYYSLFTSMPDSSYIEKFNNARNNSNTNEYIELCNRLFEDGRYILGDSQIFLTIQRQLEISQDYFLVYSNGDVLLYSRKISL
jgi:hypothetical protein